MAAGTWTEGSMEELLKSNPELAEKMAKALRGRAGMQYNVGRAGTRMPTGRSVGPYGHYVGASPFGQAGAALQQYQGRKGVREGLEAQEGGAMALIEALRRRGGAPQAPGMGGGGADAGMMASGMGSGRGYVEKDIPVGAPQTMVPPEPQRMPPMPPGTQGIAPGGPPQGMPPPGPPPGGPQGPAGMPPMGGQSGMQQMPHPSMGGPGQFDISDPLQRAMLQQKNPQLFQQLMAFQGRGG